MSDFEFDLPDLPGWFTVAAVVTLLLVAALLSAVETSITSASRARLAEMERRGSRRAALVNRLRDQRDKFISAVLLGNNLVNILGSALTTSALIALFGDAGVIYATVIMTVLVVVFGEVMPKLWAFAHADRVALILAPVARGLVALLSPFATTTGLAARGMLRILGVRVRAGEEAEAAAQELRGAIELHGATHRDATVRKERQMLRSILDLADVGVSDIMVHRRQVAAIDADQKPEAILEQALSSPHTRVPLWRGTPDNIVGILHAKALLAALRANGGDPSSLDISQIAARPWFIPDTTSLLDQLEAFRRRREHFAVVVDEYGALMGVVTLEDILEEIVGDIDEKHEFRMPGVRPQSDGSFVVDGSVTIRDLNRQFDWRLPDENAATIAGLVLFEARRIPEVGQVYTFHGLRFEILRRKRNQVATLRISVIGDAAAQKRDAGTAEASKVADTAA
ncbi:MAG: HlyC/CorC family transporter [Rhodospirillales bacterium]|nr:HlyC/CorC family transporter [Rhodospirillales bacterium]